MRLILVVKIRTCYNQKGSDPRNYRVSFEKVKNTLDFKPIFSVKDGINELINALELGLFKNSIINRQDYGNYELFYDKLLKN